MKSTNNSDDFSEQHGQQQENSTPLTSGQVRAGATVPMTHAQRQAFLKHSRLGQILGIAEVLPENTGHAEQQ